MDNFATSVEFTPEDLLRLPDGKDQELVDGRLVDKPSGGQLAVVTAQIAGRLGQFAGNGVRGWAFNGRAGYHCFPHPPRLVRKPDISFIRLGRLPDERLPGGHIPFPPDLAVEVLHPSEIYTEGEIKVREYLDVGVRLIWVVDYETRTALEYQADGRVRRLTEDDDLDGGDVLPGFRCRLGDVFPPVHTHPQPPSD